MVVLGALKAWPYPSSHAAIIIHHHHSSLTPLLFCHRPQIKSHGLQNILALRGDPPKGQETFTAVEGGFSCALDLVKYIREKHGDYFGIGIAGYPEAHPDVISEDPEEMEKAYWSDMEYLKKKVRGTAPFPCPPNQPSLPPTPFSPSMHVTLRV